MWILSRTTGTSSVSPVRAFFTLNTTVVPGFPFILSVLSLISSPFAWTPSIVMISSPHTRPALLAGESAYGSFMMTLLSLVLCMIAPMPPYVFESIIWRSSFSSSGIYTVYGSSSSSIASTPALMILSTGRESTYERLSSRTMALWISVHLPSLKLFDCPSAVTAAKKVTAIAAMVYNFLIPQKYEIFLYLCSG